MDYRFSTILTEAFLPLPLITPKEKPKSSQSDPWSQHACYIPKVHQESRTSRFKRFLRAILPTSPSTPKRPDSRPPADELGEKLWGMVATGSTKSSKKTTSTLKKHGKKNQTAVIVLAPAPASLPSFRRRDIFSKGHRSGNSGRDSKFSSITSFEALQPTMPLSNLSNSSIILSVFEYECLQSLTRRVKRGFMKQEYLTGHLSKNLLQLLCRKEKQIAQNRNIRRPRREDREAMQRAIFLGREHAGRLFLRKAVLLQRSQSVLAQLNEMIDSNVASTVNGYVELRISPETVLDFYVSLQADLKLQHRLDQDLLVMVKKYCAERQFTASINDKILTERLIQFVKNRVTVLEVCYNSMTSSIDKTIALQDRLDSLNRPM